MVAIRLEGIRKSFGGFEVLKGIDLDIKHGEFVVFVGPSGCGKSTLLRILAGLESATGGQLSFDGKDMTRTPPAERGVAMVFQSYALYPHMTVAENMTMSLRLAGVPKAERQKKAREVAEMLKLSDYLDRKPAALSGGQRQRVAIGRALVRSPDVFLFDEPLSNLDASLRVETRLGISQLHARLDNTMIYVTHDQVEAMTMADRIVILDQGRIAQAGRPMELYDHPASTFVAGFLGSPRMNFLPVTETARDGRTVTVRLEGGAEITVPVAAARADRATTLGIRPETLGPAAGGPVTGTIVAVEHLGSETLIYLNGAGGNVIARVNRQDGLATGDRVSLGFDPARAHLFAADGGALAVAAKPT